MRWGPILKDLGIFVQLPAILSAPSVIVCLVFGEWRLIPGFVVTAVVSTGLGQYLSRRPLEDERPRLVGSMVTVGGAWLAIGLLSTIPFLYWAFTGGSEPAAAPFANFWTSFFESMSGITSTGLTMAADASALPRAIQWWRTLLEWVGGVGVVVLALALIRVAEERKVLMSAEAREHRIGASFKATGRRIWWLFLGLTLLSILMFAVGGMPWWEALNHGMTGIATGGFTVTADGFAHYGNGIRVLAIVVMLLGAVSFRTYARVVIDRDWRSLAKDVPTIVLLSLFLCGVGVLLFIDRFAGTEWGLVPLAFHWASALGTCGFQTTDLTAWQGPVLLLLTLAMFVGGAAGSTTGGIKIDRAVLVVLGPLWHMRRRLSTRKGVQYYTIDGEKVNELEALQRYRSAVALTSLFVGSILVGTFILVVMLGSAYTPHEVLFEVTSAISNVGLSTGITGASLPWLGKLTMIVLMWMGRLEITAVLVFFGLPIILARSNSGPK